MLKATCILSDAAPMPVGEQRERFRRWIAEHQGQLSDAAEVRSPSPMSGAVAQAIAAARRRNRMDVLVIPHTLCLGLKPKAFAEWVAECCEDGVAVSLFVPSLAWHPDGAWRYGLDCWLGAAGWPASCGIWKPRSTGARAQKTVDEQNEIVRLVRESGMSITDVAREAGCSRQTVYTILRKYDAKADLQAQD